MRRTNRIFYALADKSRINQIKKPLPYSLNASQMPMHKGLPNEKGSKGGRFNRVS